MNKQKPKPTMVNENMDNTAISLNTQAPANTFRLKPIAFGVRAMLTGSMVFGCLSTTQANPHSHVNTPLVEMAPALAQVLLPPAENAMPTQASNWLAAGSANEQITGDIVTITQTSAYAAYNWQTYDVGSKVEVKYVDPSTTSVSVNYIADSNPSQIAGEIQSNGEVILINQNGLIFENGSVTDTSGLVASTLTPTAEAIAGLSQPGASGNKLSGLANGNSPTTTTVYAAFSANGASAQNGVGNTGAQTSTNSINIQSGAFIKSENGKPVLIIAPTIDNLGQVQSSGGQVIMAAAKDAVYLQEAPTDGKTPNLDVRGLLVEVGTGGTVTNDVGGQVSADLGNVTLIGLAVNQFGRVSASTSINENGTVRLLATQGLTLNTTADSTYSLIDATSSGTVELGTQSVTEILPKAQLVNGVETSVVASQAVAKSQLQIVGGSITMDGVATTAGHYQGAYIDVPSGQVEVTATQTPATPQTNAAANSSTLLIENGVNINVAGLDSTASMASNVIAVKLQSNELADAPVQKSSGLFGQTVYIDVRADGGLGTPLANISTALAAIPYTLEQHLGAGGTVTLNSEGSLTVQNNSAVNIAGGATQYASGYIDTTKLVTTTGQLVDIGKASPLATYVGVYGQFSVTDAKWGVTQNWSNTSLASPGVFEAGYLQGYAAGQFNVSAPDVTAMQAAVNSSFSSGEFQRSIAEQQALGGTLSIDTTAATGIQDIVIGNTADQVSAINNLDGVGSALVLDAGVLAGVANVKLTSNGAVRELAAANLQLAANGSLQASAGMINVAGNITGTGAAVNLNTVYNNLNASYDGSVSVSSGVSVNLQGGWTNDYADNANVLNAVPVNMNGGSFSIKAQGNVDVSGASINVDGGAWLQGNRTLTDGAAGSISLLALGSDNAVVGADQINHTNGSNLNITDANLSAYGLKSDGSLTLEANQVNVVSGSAPVSAGGLQPLVLTDSFFADHGFATYNITADANGLTVASGANITLNQTIWQLQAYQGADNAGGIAALSKSLTYSADIPMTLAQSENFASTLNLDVNHNYGGNNIISDLTTDENIAANVVINASPQSRINLQSDNSIYFNGQITDYAGSVSMNIVGASRDTSPYAADQGLWLDSQAKINVAGTYVTNFNNAGLADGSVLNGGTVTLDAQNGYVAAQSGSLINVAGANPVLVYQPVANGHNISYVPENSVSNGGAVQITAAEGVYLDGTMQAAGSAGASGGSLSVTLENGRNPNAPASPEIIVVQDLSKSDIQVQNQLMSAMVLSANQFGSLAQGQPAVLNGVGIIGGKQVMDAGFAALNMKAIASTIVQATANGVIQFQADANVSDQAGANPNSGYGNISLSLANAVTLDAPVISWSINNDTGAQAAKVNTPSVNLTATAITVGSSTMTPQFLASEPAAQGGAAVLNLNTHGQNGLITLQGEASTSGFNAVNMQSSQDIRLVGLLDPYSGSGQTDSYQGGFQTYANLNMTANRVYATTLSQFELATVSASGVISFHNNNNTNTPAPVLEADATLTVNANVINQDGTLLNPFGIINLDATNSINFGGSSLTSVSGQNQLIPFGVTSAGSTWFYPVDDKNTGTPINLTVGGTQTIGAIPVPEKQLNLNAQSVTKSQGAVIDLSGGGDVLASEFIPGDGGSKNVLLAGNAVGGGTSFAIIPTLSGYAPYDPYLSGIGALGANISNNSLVTGEQVTIGAGSGLAAGTYTLLPAQYAVLPGAYLITSENVTVAQDQSATRVDGAALVSGYFSIAGTSEQWSVSAADNLPNGYSEFAVQSASEVLAYSQINLTHGDSFFAQQAATEKLAVPQLAQDAGQLSAIVTAALDLPTIRGTASGIGSEVDISADQLSVVLVKDSTPGVELLASDLNKDNIGSLFLGGVRSINSATGNTVLNVKANSVTIANNVSLNNAAELIIAAKNTLSVNAGASLATQGQAGTAANTAYETTGDSAVLRVANGQQVSLNRTGSDGQTGDLQIAAGANLTAGNAKVNGALLLDETGSNSYLMGTVNLLGKGALSIAATSLNLGDTGGQTGFSLNQAQLTALQGINNVVLQGRNDIDLYGSFSTPDFNNLLLNTPVLAGIPVNGDSNIAQINANTLTLANNGGASCSGQANCSGGGSATLDVATTNLQLASTNASAQTPGNFTIAGFNAIDVNATQAVTAIASGNYAFNGVTTVTTPVESAYSGVKTALCGGSFDAGVCNGAYDFSIVTSTPATTTTTSQGVGGELDVTAANLTVDSSLIYLGGTVNLTSTALAGNGNAGLFLKANADVDVSATTQSAGLNPKVQISAGKINLTTSGNLYSAAASQLNLKPLAAGGAGGTLQINALHASFVAPVAADPSSFTQPTVDINGSVNASGGQLLVDVNKLDTSNPANNVFDNINSLAANGGFTGQVNLRVRNGDIVVDSGQTVVANSITLETDSGQISVAGELNASGANGGAITLDSGPKMDAQGHLLGNALVEVSGSLLANALGYSQQLAAQAGEGVTSLTMQSTSGWAVGDVLVGNGLAAGATITAISGDTVSLNTATTAAITAGSGISVVGNGGSVTLSAVNQVAWDNAGNSGQAPTPGSITLDSTAKIDVSSQGDYGLVNCHAQGLCGSLGSVQLMVDAQQSGGTLSNVSIADTSTINIKPHDYNINASSLSYAPAGYNSADPLQVMPQIVAVQVYNLSSPGVSDPTNAATLNQITAYDVSTASSDTASFYNQAADFIASLTSGDSFTNAGGSRLATVLPGIEAITTGGNAMTVNPGASWDLSGWRFGADHVPGQLILRASGDLNIQQNISDGYGLQTATSGQLAGHTYFGLQSGGHSWSYQLTSGADMSAANAGVTQHAVNAGNLNLSSSSELVGQRANTNAYSLTLQSVAAFAVGDVISCSGGADCGIPANTSIIAIKNNTIYLNNQINQTIFAGASVSVAPLIRTGAGNININVAGDVNMSSASSIYSAGVQDANNPWGYTSDQVLSAYLAGFAKGISNYAEYPVDGGNVSVNAGGNINVTAASATMGFFTDWLLRSNSAISNAPASWGINLALFNDSLGALGGGNISVQAGGNISNLTVAIPTTGKINPSDYAATSTTSSPKYTGNFSQPTISGGGNLSLTAGGDIAGGAFYVEQGEAAISAGGSLISGSYVHNTGSANVSLDPILALGAAQMSVSALSISLETVLNPLVIASPNKGYPGGADSLFLTYQANSSVTLTALSGNVTLDNNNNQALAATDIASAELSSDVVTTYPGSLTVNVLQGDLNIDGSMQLAPVAGGNLQLYAFGNIDEPANILGDAQVMLSLADPGNLPSILNPESRSYGQSSAKMQLLSQYIQTADYAQTPVHLNDSNPVLISTGSGSIEGLSAGNNFSFVLAKQALVSSADNISNTTFVIQNDTATSNSLISAAQNIEFSTPRDDTTGELKTANQAIQVMGPGQLTVLSGASTDLGASNGIVSLGNTVTSSGVGNPYLPGGGANLTVLAGLGGGVINAVGFAQDFMTNNAASVGFNNLFASAIRSDLLQSGASPSTAALQALASKALAAAAATQAAQGGQLATFGYKEYLTQYLQDYWNHYNSNLAVDGVMALVGQAESAALTSQGFAVGSMQADVINTYISDFSLSLQNALNAYQGTLTLDGLNTLMSQADHSALTTLSNAAAISSVQSPPAYLTDYRNSYTEQMQGFVASYGDAPVSLAVAGVLTVEAATAAKTSFDQLQQAYNGELTQSLTAIYPNINAATFSCNATTCSFENNNSATIITVSQSDSRIALLQKQLLPLVQTVYGIDEKQFGEQRAADVLTTDKDALELDMLATTEALLPGTTLLSLNPNPVSQTALTALTNDYHYDQTTGWVANSASFNVDSIIDYADVNQLNAINQLFANTPNVAADIQAVETAPNSALGKSLLTALYAAYPNIKAAIRPDLGDLSMFFSTIQTDGGGNINLLTPSGGIDAGLAINIAPKSADQLGVIAFQSGAINALVRDDFQVNESRVITLGGGDVVAGSSEGNLDAGKGVALNGAVQQSVTYDIYGNPVVTLLPAVTTSGIRSASPGGSGIKPGAIVLFAPRGVIDAGEAGIAGGNLFLDASSFKNVANISSSTGISVGAPTPPPAGISAALSGTSGLSASINKSFESSTDVGDDTAKNSLKSASAALGILSVDLLGFGD